MNRILMIVFTINTILSSCSKHDKIEQLEMDNTLEFFMGVSKVRSRAVDIPADQMNNLSSDVLKNFTDLKIELLGANGDILGDLALSDVQKEDIKAGKKIVFHSINKNAVSVKASFNTIADGESINNLQGNGVLSSMEYNGISIIEKPTASDLTIDQTEGNVIWKTLVDMRPAMSRFEVAVTTDNILYEPKKDDLNNLTEAVFRASTSRFSEETIKNSKLKALEFLNQKLQDAGKAPIADGTQGLEYTFSLTYTDKYASIDPIKSVVAVYINNFIKHKGLGNSASSRILHVNNGLGDWSSESLLSYQKIDPKGAYCNMWDKDAVGINQRNVFNLFAQSVTFPNPNAGNNELISEIKSQLPHVIIKLNIDPDGNGGDNIYRWLTIRAFSNTDESPIDKFEAGKAYVLKGDKLKFNFIIETMKVVAKYDNTEGEVTDTSDEDPTDPNPEPHKADLRVMLTIKPWESIGLTPEL